MSLDVDLAPELSVALVAILPLVAVELEATRWAKRCGPSGMAPVPRSSPPPFRSATVADSTA